MDDATGQLGNDGTETGHLVSGKNGVRFAINKMVQLPPRGAVIEPLTQFVLHSLQFQCQGAFLRKVIDLQILFCYILFIGARFGRFDDAQ
jgi:hypothetical protein